MSLFFFFFLGGGGSTGLESRYAWGCAQTSSLSSTKSVASSAPESNSKKDTYQYAGGMRLLCVRSAGARPGGLDDFGLPRGTRRLGRDGVDDERSPLLRDSKTMLEGSRGGSASLPAHSTSPFQSPRGRMSVASSHVPHPRPCGPRSCWDRCTILHIRGAAGPQRRPSHRSAPPKRCTIMSIMKHDREGHSIDFYPGGYFDYFDRI